MTKNSHRKQRAWLSVWLQEKRRKRRPHLLPAPVLVPQYPSLAVWEWNYPNPAFWYAYHQVIGLHNNEFFFDEETLGTSRQYAPDGGQHYMFIVGVDENGNEITERSNAIRPEDAVAPNNLLNSLVSHWRLDEASGVRYDAHGTNHLSDTNSVPSVAGKLGNAADFDGDTNYLSCASNAGLQAGDSDCCFAAWVYLRSDISLEQNHHFLGKWDDVEFNLAYKASATGYFAFDYGSGSVDAVTLGEPPLDNWYFVVAWHDSVSDELCIQINNGPVEVMSYPDGAAPSDGAFCLGTLGEAGGRADVYLDSVSYWKRTLTTEERTLLWNGGAGLDYASFA